MLESLGLDLMAEQLYRAMLAHPREGIRDLSLRMGVSEEEIARRLDQLSAMALIEPARQEASGFFPLDPEQAMELLLARQLAELAAQRKRIAASQAAAAQLIAECSSLQPRVSNEETERLVGPEAIRLRLAALSAEAENEVMTFAPGGAHPAADLEASRTPNAALLDRGIRMRTIYLDSVRNHQPTMDHVAWLGERGGRVRTAASLPVRMVILDRRRAVLPVDTADARVGATVISGAGTVTALCALFESIWATATPLGSAPPRDRRGLTAQEAEALRLLAAGSKDEAIAKRLGVSPRTARRIAADLMDRLDARSRFEAGVHAVQDGWLPATR